MEREMSQSASTCLPEEISIWQKIKCDVHTTSKVKYLSIDPKQVSAFKCIDCVSDRLVDQNSLIPIRQILSSNKDTIFSNFPINDFKLTCNVREVVKSIPTFEELMKDIDAFFKAFRAKINNAIDDAESKMVERARQTAKADILFDVYNKLSHKQDLKQILLSEETSLEDKSLQFKELCAKVKEIDETNSIKIKEVIEKYKDLLNGFNSKNNQNIEIRILDLLSTLNPQQNQEKNKIPIQRLLQNNKLQKTSQNKSSSSSSSFDSDDEPDSEDQKMAREDPSIIIRQLPIAMYKSHLSSYFGDSKIIYNTHETIISFSSSGGGQVLTSNIKNECGYMMKINFSHPYGIKEINDGIRIGFVPSSLKNSQLVSKSNIKGSFCSVLNLGTDIVTKGEQLSSQNLRSSTKSLEFRWCISDQKFFFADSSYNNINSVSKSYIDPLEEYRFGIYFSEIGLTDFKATITEFCEIDRNFVSF